MAEILEVDSPLLESMSEGMSESMSEGKSEGMEGMEGMGKSMSGPIWGNRRIEVFKELKGSRHRKNSKDIEELISYESLDYTMIENELLIEEKRHLNKRREHLNKIIKWCSVFGTGCGTGMIAFLLYIVCGYLNISRWGMAQNIIIHQNSLLLGYFYFLTMALLFVGIAGFLTSLEPSAAGSGISEVKSYLNGVALQKVLRWQTLVVKVVGVAFAVAGNMAIGKEGPLVHTGSIIALLLCYSSLKYRWDYYKREFVAAGAAAGISAAFGAPSGSILFVLEEAATYWSVSLIWMVMISAFLSTLTLNICKAAWSGNIEGINTPGLIAYGDLITHPYKLWEIFIFGLIGVVGGFLGGLFNFLNGQLTIWRKKYKMTTPFRRWGEVMFLCFLTASLFYWAPKMVTECKENNKHDAAEITVRYDCPEGYHNVLASLSFTNLETSIKNFFHTEEMFGWGALLLYFIIMYTCGMLTYGASIPSGLFVPAILVGCCYGRYIGEVIHTYVDTDAKPGTYALMGAASFVGGVTRLTIALTIVLMEVTNNIDYLLPLAITTLCAKFVGDVFGIAIYDLHIELKNIPFVNSQPPKYLIQLKTVDVMVHPVTTFHERELASHIYRTLSSCTHNAFPIVDLDNHLVGIMLRNQYIVLLKWKIFVGGDPDIPKPTYGDFAPGRESAPFILPKYSPQYEHKLEDYSIDVSIYMNLNWDSVSRSNPLTAVFRKYRALGLRHLIVVNSKNEVVGIITRKQLMTDFAKQLS